MSNIFPELNLLSSHVREKSEKFASNQGFFLPPSQRKVNGFYFLPATRFDKGLFLVRKVIPFGRLNAKRIQFARSVV